MFGYEDGEEFVYNDFKDYAATWKGDYFNVKPSDVDGIPWYEVEKAFWDVVRHAILCNIRRV